MRQPDRSNVVSLEVLNSSTYSAPSTAGVCMISLNTTTPTGETTVPANVAVTVCVDVITLPLKLRPAI
jgi:hypothetical protein